MKGVDYLSYILEVSEFELYKLAQQSDRLYTEYRIRKNGGGTRLISAPAAPLKKLQKRIASRLLGGEELHNAAHGYRRGRSIVSNASMHVDHDFVFNIDIKNFFDSVFQDRTRELFLALEFDKTAAELLNRIVTLRGALPQGAPSSPVIANLVCRNLDRRLAKFCAGRTWNYSRYCDDITISGNGNFDARANIIATIKSEGFTVNRKKVRLATRSGRQMVTGVVVNQKLNMPRAERRRLRAIFHQAGLDASAFSDRRNKLSGYLGLLKMIDPANSSLDEYKQVISGLKN